MQEPDIDGINWGLFPVKGKTASQGRTRELTHEGKAPSGAEVRLKEALVRASERQQIAERWAIAAEQELAVEMRRVEAMKIEAARSSQEREKTLKEMAAAGAEVARLRPLEASCAELRAKQKELERQVVEATSARQTAEEQVRTLRAAKDALGRRLALRAGSVGELREALSRCEERNRQLYSELRKAWAWHGMADFGTGNGGIKSASDRKESSESEAGTGIHELEYEVHYRRATLSYRLARRLRSSWVYHAVRWVKSRNRSVAVVEALDRRTSGSRGNEVRLLGAWGRHGDGGVSWDSTEVPGNRWTLLADSRASFGEALTSHNGKVRIRLYEGDAVIRFLKHPFGGMAHLHYNGRKWLLNLYSEKVKLVDVFLDRYVDSVIERELQVGPAMASVESDEMSSKPRGVAAPTRFTEASLEWLDYISSGSVQEVAIHVPRWLGVTASTRHLFDELYPFPESRDVEPAKATEEDIDYHAEVLLESGIGHFIFSGGEDIHFRLAEKIKKRAPDRRCDLLWHASYVQFSEDYGWKLLKLWVEGAQSGVVHTIGTVKKGMEKFFANLGCRSKFVMNYVAEVPDGASEPQPGGPHLGLWISNESYRKLPFAMVSALGLIEGAVVHGSNFSQRTRELMGLMELDQSAVRQTLIAPEGLMDAVRRTHLSLYVTFSECCPMLPLESLSVGVPCLLGPTSHLFEDDEFLSSRLVVPYPDRAEVIAEFIERAIEEREAIVDRYKEYAPSYIEAARRSVEEFLRSG